jgi:hypothetical protein
MPDGSPEGIDCYFRKLEMLFSERDADYCNAQQNPEECMCDSDPDPPAKKPEQIHKYMKAARSPCLYVTCPAKRPYRKGCHFKCLKAERDANDRYHKDQAANKIFNGYEDTPEDQPD